MLKEIDFQIFIHGHEEEYKTIKPSKNLILLGEELDKLKTERIVLQHSTLKRAKKESEAFMKSHFNIHQIPHQTPEALKEFISLHKDLSIKEMLQKYNSLGVETDPYNLPIELVPKSCWYGCIGEFGLNNANKEFLVRSKIIFDKIILSETITNLTTRIFSHEVTHTQLNSIKGSIKSFYNYEVIPIFIEYLQSLEINSTLVEFDLEKKLRLLEISKDIKMLEEYNKKYNGISADAIKCTMYLESEIKAIKLFELYLTSSKYLKQDILNNIQKIFNKEMIVEELLEKYNITLESGYQYIKKNVF